jgi:NADPH:quinone reductase-like Zn-dependent oxidoreductase
VLVRVSTVRGRRDNPGRVEQLGGNFDVIIDGVGGATLGLAVEHVAPRGVVVNIATQPATKRSASVRSASTGRAARRSTR